MRTLTRRSVLKSAAGLAVSTITAPHLGSREAGSLIPYSVLEIDDKILPSEQLTMGAIGVGGQGMHNLRNFLTCDDLRIRLFAMLIQTIGSKQSKQWIPHTAVLDGVQDCGILS